MSRIRSVHPGFFTDENLVPCSAFARLLYIGLGVEADDKGIFEWKPVQLKMKVFPGDNVDVVALLAELVEAGNVRQFEVAGKAYGAIRNFRKYQKPKTPNDVHPMPDEIAEYVAFPRKGEIATAEPASLPPDGEKSPQMEDGGGKREDEDTTPPPVTVAAPASGARDLFGEVWDAFPQNPASVEALARKEFDRLTAKDQNKLLDAARRYRRWFAAECVARERTEEAGARFVPFLSKWIATGAWLEADALPIKGEGTGPPVPMVRLDRDRDRDLWTACEAVMGKKAPTHDMSWPFKADVVEAARAKLTEAVH